MDNETETEIAASFQQAVVLMGDLLGRAERAGLFPLPEPSMPHTRFNDDQPGATWDIKRPGLSGRQLPTAWSAQVVYGDPYVHVHTPAHTGSDVSAVTPKMAMDLGYALIAAAKTAEEHAGYELLRPRDNQDSREDR